MVNQNSKGKLRTKSVIPVDKSAVKSYEIKSSIDIHSAMDVEIAKILIKNEKLNKKFF